MKIYFSGSIRGGREDSTLYREIIKLLKEYGSVLTEYIGDVSLDNNGELLGNKEIHDRDLSLLNDAEIVVAEVTTPSLGVGYEIGKATEWDKPVLCLFRPEGKNLLSAMIAGSNGVVVSEYRDLSDLKITFDEFIGLQKKIRHLD
jgi:nucleoside 2-deoxyribosyltransferase